MKPSRNTASKLQLRKETIRILTAHDLKLVAGGTTSRSGSGTGSNTGNTGQRA